VDLQLKGHRSEESQQTLSIDHEPVTHFSHHEEEFRVGVGPYV